MSQLLINDLFQETESLRNNGKKDESIRLLKAYRSIYSKNEQLAITLAEKLIDLGEVEIAYIHLKNYSRMTFSKNAKLIIQQLEESHKNIYSTNMKLLPLRLKAHTNKLENIILEQKELGKDINVIDTSVPKKMSNEETKEKYARIDKRNEYRGMNLGIILSSIQILSFTAYNILEFFGILENTGPYNTIMYVVATLYFASMIFVGIGFLFLFIDSFGGKRERPRHWIIYGSKVISSVWLLLFVIGELRG